MNVLSCESLDSRTFNHFQLSRSRNGKRTRYVPKSYVMFGSQRRIPCQGRAFRAWENDLANAMIAPKLSSIRNTSLYAFLSWTLCIVNRYPFHL